MIYTTPYIPPTLTVDLVLFQIINSQLCVLLMKRPNDPFKDMWALPGGYNPQGETTLQALKRIVQTKVAVDIDADLRLVEQLYTFDIVGRDPRGHAVSITYLGCGQDISVTGSPNTAVFFPVNDLPAVAYDHNDIIAYAHKRLASKITYTNAAFAFLPENFTLTQLQSVYQSIFGRTLDKRNFRKKFLSLDLITKTDHIEQASAHRPAALYTFRSNTIEELPRSFE